MCLLHSVDLCQSLSQSVSVKRFPLIYSHFSGSQKTSVLCSGYLWSLLVRFSNKKTTQDPLGWKFPFYIQSPLSYPHKTPAVQTVPGDMSLIYLYYQWTPANLIFILQSNSAHRWLWEPLWQNMLTSSLEPQMQKYSRWKLFMGINRILLDMIGIKGNIGQIEADLIPFKGA